MLKQTVAKEGPSSLASDTTLQRGSFCKYFVLDLGIRIRHSGNEMYERRDFKIYVG